MTAGRGIVHSERTPPELREKEHRVFGIQVWVAHPIKDEETEPAFYHHPATDLPEITLDGVHLRLILGKLAGLTSPVKTFSPIFYADTSFDSGTRFTLAPEYQERAVYIAEGGLTVEGATTHGPGEMVVFKAGSQVTLEASSTKRTRAMLLGGAKLDGERHIYWNFVASSKERLERAKADWREGRFPPVPGETEFIPLPKEGPAEVRYP